MKTLKPKKQIITEFLEDVKIQQEALANYIGSQTIKAKAEAAQEAIERLEKKLKDFNKPCSQVEVGALVTLSESMKGCVEQEEKIRGEYLVIDERLGFSWPIAGASRVSYYWLDSLRNQKLKFVGDMYVFHSHRPGELGGTYITTKIVNIR